MCPLRTLPNEEVVGAHCMKLNFSLCALHHARPASHLRCAFTLTDAMSPAGNSLNPILDICILLRHKKRLQLQGCRTTMNSLVVLLSAVALASAKPSGLLNAGVVSYAAPAVATLPVAVSQQSRIDINSPPAIVSTLPAAAPLALSAPITTAAIAPTLIRSTGITTPLLSSSNLLGTAAITSPVIASPTLIGGHLIRKRSVPLIGAAPIVSANSALPVLSSLPAAPIGISSPLGLTSPLAVSSPLALSSPLGLSTPLGLSSPLIANTW
ncbi:uncharacterized protein ACR2FA_012619 [Aphomia sociella]